MTDFLTVAPHAVMVCAITSLLGLVLMAIWREHTPESRLLAADIAAALDGCGKQGALAATIFDTKESTAAPRLSRALHIGEPLNIYRLAVLGEAFWVPFCTRVIERFGGAVFSPKQVALVRAADQAPRRPLRMKETA